ncbi:glycerol-3-phosphate phosphatase [Carcharodon carcharias]|uniref:glycerol-3-phosphate phosphatase n=1 Tax=Carcharodon carcharias TaxID=13397 RepID=UPI001B7EFDA8|nr:glycerol-3-phosphate phosphatase [Carcharodon carcharias]
MAAGCVQLSRPLCSQILASVDTLLFDCDGVLWRGESPIPGAVQLINRLQEQGKRVFFLTNNSTKSRQMYGEKLRALGFQARPEQVFGTAPCSALYLRQEARLRGSVYLIGGATLRGELQTQGIACSGSGPGPELTPGPGPTQVWAAEPLDPAVGAVLVGFDEHFTYMKLCRATRYLQNPACIFLATNTDTLLPLEGGGVPGTGCLVKAIEAASNRTAHVIGKPSTFMLECMVKEHGINPSRTVMVGDRLDTDILMGSNCGLRTILTLTGVSTLEEARAHQESNSPDRHKLVPSFYVESVADLLPALD